MLGRRSGQIRLLLEPQQVLELHGHQSRRRACHERVYRDGKGWRKGLADFTAEMFTDKCSDLFTLFISFSLLPQVAFRIQGFDHLPDIEVVSAPPAGQRRGVMAADASQGRSWPFLRGEKALLATLKEEQPIAEPATLLHGVPETCWNNPQILADDDGFGFL